MQYVTSITGLRFCTNMADYHPSMLAMHIALHVLAFSMEYYTLTTIGLYFSDFYGCLFLLPVCSLQKHY